jgi:hypothetical protein
MAQFGDEYGKSFMVFLDAKLDFSNVYDVTRGDLVTIDYFKGMGIL